MNNIF